MNLNLKSGWKTSEFYLVAALVMNLLVTMNLLPQAQADTLLNGSKLFVAGITAIASVLWYIWHRHNLKVEAMKLSQPPVQVTPSVQQVQPVDQPLAQTLVA